MGSQPNFFNVPGADKHSYTLNNLKNAEKIKRKIVECFELADHTDNLELKRELLTFVVVGAGATGIEYVVELHDLCRNVMVKDFEFIDFERDCRIILLEAMDRILPNMDRNLVEYAMKNLRRKHIEIMTDTRVTKITDRAVELNGKTVMPTHNVLWAAGVKGNAVIETLPLEQDPIRRVKLNAFLQAPGRPNVFALGDNACFVPEGESKPLMQTAQVAVQEAGIVSQNIVRHYKGEPLIPFKYLFLGSTLSLGEKKGLADLVGKLKLRGFWGWLSWKIIYLKHLLVIEDTGKALWDWFYDMVYNRHLARFKLH
jgi:NADH dehydrogenase